jgi:hypothetical protein
MVKLYYTLKIGGFIMPESGKNPNSSTYQDGGRSAAPSAPKTPPPPPQPKK